MIETRFEEHMYKKDHFNQLTMIFQKHSLEKHGIILKYEAIMLCFQNIKTRR
jgi:hypothetical protein